MWRARYRRARAAAAAAVGAAPPPQRVFTDALTEIKARYKLGKTIGKGADGALAARCLGRAAKQSGPAPHTPPLSTQARTAPCFGASGWRTARRSRSRSCQRRG